MSGQIYIGNKLYAQYAPAPATGMTKSNIGYSESIDFDNGGTWIARSQANHASFQMDFPIMDTSNAASLEFYSRLSDGEFGNDFVYWVDPMAQDQNLFAVNWGAPGLAEQNWKPLISGSVPTYSNTSTNTYGLPYRKATYTVTNQNAPATGFSAHTFIIPPDCTLWLGGAGSVTGTAGVFAEANIPTGLTNYAIYPSPQTAATGQASSSGTGGTASQARLTGVGVNGGFGWVTTWTVGNTASTWIAGVGSSAAGANSMPLAPNVTITPSIYVGSNVAQSVQLQVIFVDASNATIGTTTFASTQTTLVANGPLVRLVGTPVTSPANTDHFSIRVVPGTSPILFAGTRTNFHTNPKVALTTTGYVSTSAGGTATLARQATGGPLTNAATWVKLAFTASPTASPIAIQTSGTGTSGIPVSASTAYAFSGYVSSDQIPTGSSVRLDVDWYDSTGASISSITGTQIILGSASIWERRSALLTSPPLAAYARSRFSFSTYQAAVSPFYIGASAVLVEQSTTLNAYFDGDTTETGRTIAWTGTANASTSTRSGDRMVVDRVSTAPGAYFDGANGGTWTGVAYASTSVATALTSSIPLVADTAAPALTASFDGSVYKYVRVYVAKTDATASTATVAALWAQIRPTGVTPTLTRHIPGKGATGLQFDGSAIPESYIMAGRHLTGMSFTLTEVEQWQ